MVANLEPPGTCPSPALVSGEPRHRLELRAWHTRWSVYRMCRTFEHNPPARLSRTRCWWTSQASVLDQPRSEPNERDNQRDDRGAGSGRGSETLAHESDSNHR